MTMSVSLNVAFGQCVSGGTMFEWINTDAYYKVKADILCILNTVFSTFTVGITHIHISNTGK